MSTAVVPNESVAPWQSPPVALLDEAVWRAWAAKGRAQELRTNTAFVKSIKWISIAALLVTAGLWSSVMLYGIVVRFIVMAAAILLMLKSINPRPYTFAAVFGGLAVLYNPVVPVFSFSSAWQRILVLASAVPFAASLVWRNLQESRHA